MSASPSISTAVRRAFGNWYTEPHQDNLWRYLAGGGKRACAVWHRRGGKDDVSLRWTCRAAHQRKGNYWHMLPQAEQARKAIWEAINPHTGRRRIDEAFPLEMRKRTRSNEMMIEFQCGSIWQVVGSDNYNALVGSPPVGITFSEWSLADPSCWAYMRPILRENDGWAIFIYTPRGRNHGLTLLESAKKTAGWFWEVLPATKTGVFTADDLEAERQELMQEYGQELGQNMFEQEYLCSFDAAILGAIYAKWIRVARDEGRLGTVECDPALPVHTAWDLGFGDSTAIWWFQIAHREVHLIDYYESTGKDAAHYCSQIFGHKVCLGDKRQVIHGEEIPEAAHRKNWRYGKHYGPHDAGHKVLAAGGRSVGDQCNDLGVNMTVLPAIAQHAQIAAGRATLERAWIDEKRCERGISALSSYHFPWDDKAKILKDEPAHDWSSHGSDALEIIGQVWQPLKTREDKPKPRFLHDVTADEVFFPRERSPVRSARI